MKMKRRKTTINLLFMAILLAMAPMTFSAAEAADKPNILVIWGDDIGITNISARPYRQGRHDVHRLLR
jgi:arylsulfatase